MAESGIATCSDYLSEAGANVYDQAIDSFAGDTHCPWQIDPLIHAHVINVDHTIHDPNIDGFAVDGLFTWERSPTNPAPQRQGGDLPGAWPTSQPQPSR